MDRVIVTAPAKVNLHLCVGSRRPDGYHDVETVLQSLEVADEVSLDRADNLSLTCEPTVGASETGNLGYRAAEALAHRLGRSPAVSISIRKSLPYGAGLGGGSSDAAAVLVGMAALWGMDPRDPLLVSVAADIGSDVPFFLVGGAALYTGRGDEFVRSLPFLDMSVALVKPPPPVPTGLAYAAFDRLPEVTSSDSSRLQVALASGDLEAV
ncbi:MAG: 4-(cytidine 5'-diphospho)-2-C-methyl-D-erythritol kinase, partial [Actinomycetota bacterium]|nr:4-(cytidine 5'-diphospho)-2-C-methyl-D-erythritol kinase [Actinomycetota bacterium]